MNIKVCANCGKVIVYDNKTIPKCTCLSPNVMYVDDFLKRYDYINDKLIKEFIDKWGLWTLAFKMYGEPYKDYSKGIKKAVLHTLTINYRMFADYLLNNKDKLFTCMRTFDVKRSVERYKELRS